MHHTLHIVAISNVMLGLVLLLLSIFFGQRIPLMLRQMIRLQAVGLTMMGAGTLLLYGPYDDAGTLLSIAGGIISVVATVRYLLSWQAGKPTV